MADPVSPARDLKLAPLSGLMVLCCLFGPMAAYGLASLAVWGDGTSATLRVPAVLGGIIWIFAAGLGILLTVFTTRGKVSNLGFSIMAASIIRMFAALAVGILLFIVLKPEVKTFWFSFLITGITCLIVETAWVLRTLVTQTQSKTLTPDGVR